MISMDNKKTRRAVPSFNDKKILDFLLYIVFLAKGSYRVVRDLKLLRTRSPISCS